MKVIDYKYLPARLPLWPTVTVGLLLDRFGVPGWLWGAAGTFIVLLWLVFFFAWWKQKPVHPKDL